MRGLNVKAAVTPVVAKIATGKEGK